MEAMIYIRRSDYEQLLSQQEELIELVHQLRAEIALKRTMLADDYINPSKEMVKLSCELDELLAVDISGFHQKEQAFIKRLQKNRQSIFTFPTFPNVPLGNNASERAIRNVKVKTKVSGQFRNAEGKGADRFARIRYVIDTSLKNGQDVCFALKCLANLEYCLSSYNSFKIFSFFSRLKNRR
jgi:hypothetical protein